MGTKLSRSDFRRQYPAAYQGLFVFYNAKRIPKDQPTLSLGYELSKHLLDTPIDRYCIEAESNLCAIVADYKAVTLTRIEILFMPALRQDAIGALLALCRNRKICICWPGTINGNMLTYADPSSPEYYEVDYSRFVDTYVITD